MWFCLERPSLGIDYNPDDRTQTVSQRPNTLLQVKVIQAKTGGKTGTKDKPNPLGHSPNFLLNSSPLTKHIRAAVMEPEVREEIIPLQVIVRNCPETEASTRVAAITLRL